MVDSVNKELLYEHLRLVLKANERTNITAIKSFEDGVLYHIEDSLAAMPEFEGALPGDYLDIGSGAGFPGIPLAIESGRTTVLIDSVRKKTEILDSFIRELKLSNVSTYWGRIEEYGATQRNRFSVVTARALAQLSILMEFASPLLKEGGSLICYKANLDEEELSHALSLQEELALYLSWQRMYRIGDRDREILVFIKKGNPSLHLPRRVGKAQKHPL